MTTRPALPPLYVRNPEYVGDAPFKDDLFNRSALAETLTGYIDRTKDGCVMGIDAPWGEGKSWFGRNWRAKLNAEGYKTIYLDAFERDYTDDPFTILTAEILDAVSEGASRPVEKRFLTASLKLGKALLPAAAKITINAIGKTFLGAQDITGDVAEMVKKLDEEAADVAEKYIAARLAESEAEKKSVVGFRTALTDFAAAQAKPVVFFIDELDRCRPDFAVRVVERVKHFFDVPNLVFVLLLNRDQLRRAIEGVYGHGFDADAYLGKFIHLFLALPKSTSIDSDKSNATSVYASHVAKRYRFENSVALDNFVYAFGQLSAAFDMSLRDVEKAFTLLALAGVSESAAHLAWPIVVKLKYPDVFRGLLAGDRASHQKAIDLLQKIDPGDNNCSIRDYFLAIHTQRVKGREELPETLKQALTNFAPRITFHGDVLRFLMKRIDIALMD
ncbi:MAG: putative P-loop ATPase [Candidatus Accumulibacter regalis]|jgi:Predicted P-loop ATPase|uniref:P-loop ATPase n=1 Tax=Accumulibacter regalis TaxID=522306 RepID=A0A011Q477_ACCRE|nr:P-loop NTPase fold protein [Accumulibacter sp.]EXI84097.1 MAG: putative P-loop ATPase [Candidatus Accumulibacter regalis]HRE73023.1 P-loop NTPase fold protein [Accumulibacter sp.]